MPKQTLITSRDPQGLHTVSLFETAYNNSKLDDTRAQRVNDRGDELQERVAKIIIELSMSNRYANEEIISNYTYPEEYKGPKLITEQIRTLAEIFDINPNYALEFSKNLPPLASFVPTDALNWTGYFAILYGQRELAVKYFPEVTDSNASYCDAVQLVHNKIAISRPFYNYRKGQVTPAQLRVTTRTARALNLLAETQKGDILIVAAQLGFHHRGRSVRRTRELFTENEFGLGSLAVGSIILTHPERLVRRDELDMDCPGDEFAPVPNSGVFSFTPFFGFSDSRVKFGEDFNHRYEIGFGSVSGFLP